MVTTLLFWGSLLLNAQVMAKSPENGNYDPITGLVIADDYQLVRAHCTACHSAKLVTQNRMTKDNWLATIRWMQKSQGLWSLGENESAILDYLGKYYGSVKMSRRAAIPAHLMPKLN